MTRHRVMVAGLAAVFIAAPPAIAQIQSQPGPEPTADSLAYAVQRGEHPDRSGFGRLTIAGCAFRICAVMP